jgi:hypothetical protein
MNTKTNIPPTSSITSKIALEFHKKLQLKNN